MLQFDPYQLSNLMRMAQPSNSVPRMPTQPIPPQMYQQPRAMAQTASPSYWLGAEQGPPTPPQYGTIPPAGGYYGPQLPPPQYPYTYPIDRNNPNTGIFGTGGFRPTTG